MSELSAIDRTPGRARRWLLAGVLVVVAVTGLVFWGTRRNERAAGSAAGERPAGAPMAGMQMSSDGTVRLSASQLRQFGVTFGSVEQRELQDEVRTVGIVTLDETRVAQVTLKYGGWVERLYVDFTGRAVRRGEPLLDIYSPELVAAQEELLLAAKLDLSLGESALPGVSGGPSHLADIARRRLRLLDVPDAEIDQVLESGQVQRTTTVRAPVSGVVVDKQVLQGQAIEPGQALYTVADLARVWVEAELREPHAASVREGSAALVELAAFPGQPVSGRVEYVYPTVQVEARTLKARIALPNPEGTLKPGMYATVRLSGPSRSALTVPSSAVVHTGVRDVVFVDLGGGRLLPKEVETGQVAGELTEILAGLEPGQRVVTSAQYLLDSESNIAEVMRSMIGQGQSGAGGMEGMDMGGSGADTMAMPGMDMPPRGR